MYRPSTSRCAALACFLVGHSRLPRAKASPRVCPAKITAAAHAAPHPPLRCADAHFEKPANDTAAVCLGFRSSRRTCSTTRPSSSCKRRRHLPSCLNPRRRPPRAPRRLVPWVGCCARGVACARASARLAPWETSTRKITPAPCNCREVRTVPEMPGVVCPNHCCRVTCPPAGVGEAAEGGQNEHGRVQASDHARLRNGAVLVVRACGWPAPFAA